MHPVAQNTNKCTSRVARIPVQGSMKSGTRRKLFFDLFLLLCVFYTIVYSTFCCPEHPSLTSVARKTNKQCVIRNAGGGVFVQAPQKFIIHPCGVHPKALRCHPEGAHAFHPPTASPGLQDSIPDTPGCHPGCQRLASPHRTPGVRVGASGVFRKPSERLPDAFRMRRFRIRKV